MENIVLLTNDPESGLRKAVTAVCTGYGGIQVFDGNHLYQSCPLPCFGLFCISPLEELYIRSSIIITDPCTSLEGCHITAENSLMIIPAHDSSSLQTARNTGCLTIDCGIQGNHTLTFSSMEQERHYMVSLNRSIHWQRIQLEPCEIPVLSTFFGYPLLATVCVLLLTGISTEQTLYIPETMPDSKITPGNPL